MSSSFAPRTEDDAADRESDQRPPHVNQDKRPGICFKSGEHSNRRVFYEEKREPAHERDLQPCDCIGGIKPPNQPGERVVNDDRADDCEHVSADIMRTFDVSHRARVQIQPFLAEDSVPTPADDLIHDDQDPNCKMIDLRVHENLRDYAGVRSSIANRFLC